MRDNVIQDDLLEMSPGLQYIPLSYVKVEKEKKERPESVQYDDMIRTVAQGSKCILLQGNPGSGKTTTLRKICHDFAKGGPPPEIKMVIRVILGDMEKGSEMKDLLTTCIDETHQDLIKDIGSYAEEVNGEGVLFLLDGFDGTCQRPSEAVAYSEHSQWQSISEVILHHHLSAISHGTATSTSSPTDGLH